MRYYKDEAEKKVEKKKQKMKTYHKKNQKIKNFSIAGANFFFLRICSLVEIQIQRKKKKKRF